MVKSMDFQVNIYPMATINHWPLIAFLAPKNSTPYGHLISQVELIRQAEDDNHVSDEGNLRSVRGRKDNDATNDG